MQKYLICGSVFVVCVCQLTKLYKCYSSPTVATTVAVPSCEKLLFFLFSLVAKFFAMNPFDPWTTPDKVDRVRNQNFEIVPPVVEASTVSSVCAIYSQ